MPITYTDHNLFFKYMVETLLRFVNIIPATEHVGNPEGKTKHCCNISSILLRFANMKIKMESTKAAMLS